MSSDTKCSEMRCTVPCLQTEQELQLKCARLNVQFGEKEDRDEEYEVEGILKDSVEKGIHWYLVKWKNYPVSSASWEPKEHLTYCDQLLKDYHVSKCLLFPNGGNTVNHDVLESFIRKVTRKGSSDVAVLRKICSVLGKSVDLEFPITSSLLKKLKASVVIILGLSHKQLLKLKEDLLNIMQFATKREKTLRDLLDFELKINGDFNIPAIRVVNHFDCEGPPNYQFVNDYIFVDVSIDNEPLLGCECVACDSKVERTCCPGLANEKFPYNRYGRLRLKPGYPIYECNKLCRCDSSCSNRIVQRGQMVKLEIFKTEDRRGWGLRTLERIQKDQFVMEYIGEVITSDKADQRRYDDGDSYLFDLDFENNCTCMYTVDAKHYGNASHFINHSCDPNMHVFAVWINHLNPYLPRLAFFAKKAIKSGEELTFDYRMSKDTPFHNTSAPSSPTKSTASQSSEKNQATPSKVKKIPCRCGSSKCRGFLF